MGNFSNSLKKFLANKNTVTVLGLILGVVAIVVGYYYRIDSVTKPVTLWIANKQIPAGTHITTDMLTTIKMPEREVRKLNNVLRNQSQIINKRVHYNTTIPKNGFFYAESVLEPDDYPNSVYGDMLDTDGLFILETKNFQNLEAVPISKIMPGQYIDIYFMTKLKTGENIGQWAGDYFLKSVQVRDITDSSDRPVHRAEKAGSPAKFYLILPKELADLLNNATRLDSMGGSSGYTFKFIPRVRNQKYTDEPSKLSYDQYIFDYISDHIIKFNQ